MARHKDSMIAELKEIRRGLAARLIKARAEGRELDELRAIENEGFRAYREAVRGFRNGRRRKPAPASPRRKR